MADPQLDPRFLAGIDLLERTGIKQFQLRYSDDEEPVIWMVLAEWKQGKDAAAALDPLRAMLRLLDQTMDGGACAHCGRVTGVTDDWEVTMPLDSQICWYQYDPEVQKFRRGCEGDERRAHEGSLMRVGRNERCPCGSGKKFKHCHGRRVPWQDERTEDE